MHLRDDFPLDAEDEETARAHNPPFGVFWAQKKAAMDARATLSVLNTATEWFNKSSTCPGLRCDENQWYMIEDGQRIRRLRMYVSPEEDVTSAWSSLCPDKHLPLAACDDDPHRDPGVLLLQADSTFTIHVYWFAEQFDEHGSIIQEWGVYMQTPKLMHSMRLRVGWIVALLSWHKGSKELAYRPDGAGFERARKEFEEAKALM